MHSLFDPMVCRDWGLVSKQCKEWHLRRTRSSASVVWEGGWIQHRVSGIWSGGNPNPVWVGGWKSKIQNPKFEWVGGWKFLIPRSSFRIFPC